MCCMLECVPYLIPYPSTLTWQHRATSWTSPDRLAMAATSEHVPNLRLRNDDSDPRQIIRGFGHVQDSMDQHVQEWDPEIKSFLVRSKQPGLGCHQLSGKQPLQQRAPEDNPIASNYFFR